MRREQHTPLPATVSPGGHGVNARNPGTRFRQRKKPCHLTLSLRSYHSIKATVSCLLTDLYLAAAVHRHMNNWARKRCLLKAHCLAGPLEGDKQGAPTRWKGEQKHEEVAVAQGGNTGHCGSTTGFRVLLRGTFQNLPWAHASAATQTARGYGNFSGPRGKEKPRTSSSSLFSRPLYLLINCLEFIHLVYNSAATRSNNSNNNIKMHLRTSLCLHYFAFVSSKFKMSFYLKRSYYSCYDLSQCER